MNTRKTTTRATLQIVTRNDLLRQHIAIPRIRTSKSGGDSRGLPVCIPPCISPECDACTCNMFSYLGSLVRGRWWFASGVCQRLTTIDQRPFTTSNHPFSVGPNSAPSAFPLHPQPMCNSFHLGNPQNQRKRLIVMCNQSGIGVAF